MRAARQNLLATATQGIGVDLRRLLMSLLVICGLIALIGLNLRPPIEAPSEVVAEPSIPPTAPSTAVTSSTSSGSSSDVVTPVAAVDAHKCLAAEAVRGADPAAVTIAGNRPVGTYLCEYFSAARAVSGGCQLNCVAEGQPDVKCTILHKATQQQLYTVDVVVNHHGPVPLKRATGPLATMYYTGESNFSEPKKSTASYLSQYDIIVSFHTFRKYHFTWTSRFHADFMKIIEGKRTWPSWSSQQDAVAVFVSRCKKGGRDAIIRELSKHITVHSFGKCVQTHHVEREHPDCAALRGGRYPQKLCVFARYRYVLTLDNSHETDYVTEKVYHGLLSGAIPIYDGAPNFDDFIPDRNAVVLMSDFAAEGSNTVDFAKLVAHLRALTPGSEAMQRHIAWRSARSLGEWNPTFVKNMLHHEPTCDICRDIAEKRCQLSSSAK